MKSQSVEKVKGASKIRIGLEEISTYLKHVRFIQSKVCASS